MIYSTSLLIFKHIGLYNSHRERSSMIIMNLINVSYNRDIEAY